MKDSMKENRFPRIDKPRQKIALLLAPLLLTACVKTIPTDNEAPINTKETTVHTTIPEEQNLPIPDLPGQLHTTVPAEENLPNPGLPGQLHTTVPEK